jgi:phosphatidylserine/phosphatidylglycerophosphate/cardiolipin synthase-like enzyme
MRFKSAKVGGFQVFAVTGINTISFGISSTARARKGLLGFAVERHDPREDQRYFMYGFKVFKSVIPQPDENTQVSTFDHPVQSFSWDDFTAKSGREYEYFFHPLKGDARNLDRSARPIRIRVETEPLYSTGPHDVFFNRGVASSQAYRRRFGNVSPFDLPPAKQREALQWLSRDLDDAMLRFIRRARRNDSLLGCFYEFRYPPVAEALKAAIDRGVNVRLIVDGKENASRDARGVLHPSFPREENLAMLAAAGIPADRVMLREARRNDIQHNKFMVLLKGVARRPTEVWTGSTNLSMGGVHGQTNVGHWLRDAQVATQFLRYWELLESDPGSRAGDDASTARGRNAAQRAAVEALGPAPSSLTDISPGTTAIFSPRTGLSVLDLYVGMADGAKDCTCLTLAFGINKRFREKFGDNTPASHIIFLLLERRDEKPPSDSTTAYVAINASKNVYKAWGAFIKDPVYRFARETSTRALKLNVHVAYIHSKFLLMDPLGDDPVIVTGSANFSDASTNANDENMLIIRGDRRAADIYFTEFNRLFNHYYFRAVHEATTEAGRGDDAASVFLDETDAWLSKYASGKLKAKRLALYTGMAGFTRL